VRAGSRGRLDHGKFITDEDSGEVEVTGVLVSTSHTYPCPPLNRYRTLARAATFMADGGALVAMRR
jgi:hypothetical protein